MNYSDIYDDMSHHSSDFHQYQVMADPSRCISPLGFPTSPEHNNTSLIPIYPSSSTIRQDRPSPSLVSPRDISISQRGVAGFVSKLYQCLQSTGNERKYARWCSHQGKDMFIIECIPEFTQHVLPLLFKHCKFQSFVRQLNIYGFQRDTDARKSKDSKDKDSCRWSHEDFHPGRRDLLHRIRRKPTKSTRRRVVKVEDSETILKMQEEEDSADDDMDQRRSSSSASSVHGLDYASPYESQSNSLIHVTLPKPTALPDEFDFMGAESEREIDQDIASELITAQRRFDELQAFYKSRLAEQQLRIRNLENALCCYPEVKQPMLTSMAAETYYAPYDMNMPFDNTHNNTMNQPVQQSHWMQPNNSSYTP